MTIKDAFKIFDKNSDGSISTKEFRIAFKKMDIGLTDDDITEMINHLDKNGDGQINFKEFEFALK